MKPTAEERLLRRRQRFFMTARPDPGFNPVLMVDPEFDEDCNNHEPTSEGLDHLLLTRRTH